MVEEVKRLMELMEKQNDALKEANRVNENAQNTIGEMSKSNLEIVQALKNIHIALGTQYDFFKDNDTLMGIYNVLNTFVLSSGAIKAGVVSEKLRREND